LVTNVTIQHPPLWFRLRIVAIALGIATLVVSATPDLGRAAVNKFIQRLKGTVGYQVGDAGPFTTVAGSQDLPDDAFAITQDRSAALLQLPDSSLVSLGMNTRVQVGAFNAAANGPGATITLNGGALRFEIKRPQGGVANYRFVTPTSQVGVRGTVGLLALLNGQTTVACLACAADSITVTVAGQTYTLASGQVLVVSAAGTVTTSTITSATLSTFSIAGVSTSATVGIAGATAGVVGANAIPPAVLTGAAAAAAVGIGVDAISNHASPAPAGTVQGAVTLQGHAPQPASTPRKAP
jgi:hypothetical protein